MNRRFNQCAWCVPQKSIAGAVGVTLGNAPYKIGVLLRSAFGIILDYLTNASRIFDFPLMVGQESSF
ncbi:MAG: hypothetical protein EWV92_22220 [Microcystis aeruginosa Ma_MB_S_20031200_S102]|uniref:Uncharacterized protein n=1 Tax=Microcystis aeruginosa Ma_MB_S_20031200_S102 TaxID=2486254 RepID=A0A552E7Q5_MICAE|nr:MAG: hypothetical protein EWV79_05675 [Microcystis aeruginosa Ma_MB_S_20031200_S102D]TRU30472.1 MAG: hypothetical protein EWV92_22220 [Microcystis aeruginosa Ma_MB_S_20031200_S102]